MEGRTLSEIAELLESDPGELSPENARLQEAWLAKLPALEVELFAEYCPEEDYRFPWDVESKEDVRGYEKGFLGGDDIDDPDETMVQVFFATTRDVTQSKHPERIFGAKRSEIRYGTCHVSIPPNHKTGKLERPSMLRFEFRPNPDRHMVILDVNIQEPVDFFECVKARMTAFPSRTAFIFVHGYNVTFTDAALRTAQMACDLNFQGAPVFYSWPSKGRFISYPHDEANIEWATSSLRGFLEDFMANTEADDVVLIGHSMGNRGLARAVMELAREKPQLAKKLKEIILAAPDIDADVFKRDIVPAMARFKRPITMYAGSTDFALRCSKLFHGYPRAGHLEDGLVVVPGMETIDATNFATGFLRHSYISSSRDIIHDIAYLIRHGHRAKDRPALLQREDPAGLYWAFKP